MVYQSGTDSDGQQPALKHAIKSMPRWKWHLLMLGLTVGMIGVGGQVYGFFRGQNAPVNAPAVHQAAPAPSASPAPAGSSGFVGNQPAPANSQTVTDTDTSPTPSAGTTPLWTPFMTRVGFSLFIGIFVGVIFRTFLKTAMGISLLVIGGAMALRYFNIVNVDLTSVKAETAQATNWFADQGYRLKDMLFHALPSTTSAGLGFILGLKRR